MSQVQIVIPSVFLHFTEGKSECALNAITVKDALMQLVDCYPDLRSRLLNEDDQLWTYLQVFVNEDNVRDREGLATTLRDRDEVLIVPALSGG